MYRISKIKGSKYSYVDTNGQIFRKRDNELYYKVLAQQVNNSGYYRAAIPMEDGSVRYYLVHRLVAEAFLENPLMLETVNHKDGIKYNNSLNNLEWSSRTDNINHARDNGLLVGRPSYECYAPELVEKIKSEYTGEFGDRKRIAKKLNVSEQTVRRILGKYDKTADKKAFLCEEINKEYVGRWGQIKELSQKHGISEYKVRAYLRKN